MESQTRGRARLPWTICAAVLAHAVAWASVAHVEPRFAVDDRTEPSLGDVDLEVLPPASEDTAPPSAPAPARPAVPDDEHARLGATRARPDSVVPQSGAALESPASRETAPDEGTWTFSPGADGSRRGEGPLAGRALDGAVRAGVDATLAQERAEQHANTVVIPAFTPDEIALGLAPGGVLVSLGRDIVRRSRVPDSSRATLQFDTDAKGVVVACRVLDVTSGWPEWDEATREIMTASRAKPPMRIPSGARGVSITLDVSCELKTVDGDNSRGFFDKAAHLPLLRVTHARLVDVSVL